MNSTVDPERMALFTRYPRCEILFVWHFLYIYIYIFFFFSFWKNRTDSNSRFSKDKLGQDGIRLFPRVSQTHLQPPSYEELGLEHQSTLIPLGFPAERGK